MPAAANPPSAQPRTYLANLAPAQRFRGTYAIANAQLGKTKQDKPFLKCLISDKTAQLPARMWSIDPFLFRRLPTDGFVHIEAESQPYQGELQIIIQEISPVEPSPELLCELLPCAARPADEMFAEVIALLDTLSHPAAKALAKAYLDDDMLMSMFRQAPAAKSMHHAYLGGLLDHTLNLMKVANAALPFYPKLNRDVVLLGLFLHDLAKTRELIYDRTFGYTDRGELIGHIVDGAIMLHDKAQSVMRTQGIRLPRNFVLILQHIILSHHDKAEFGAAKPPSTPEAIFVALLDNLDAKTFIALNAARPDIRAGGDELGGNFTEKQWALDAKLFRPDPLGE